MALVTLATPPANTRHIIGDLAIRFFNVSGASGSTLDTGIRNIQFINRQSFTAAGTASLITGLSVSGSVLTFTSSGTMVNEIVEVIGDVG